VSDGGKMNLDFGISTMVYYQKPIEKLLPHLIKSKIDTIEIRPGQNHFQPQEISELLKLKKRLDQKGIIVKAIHMPMNGVDISHPQEYERIKSVREIEKAILMAYHLRADLVVVHPGAIVNNSDDRKKRIYLSVESLKEIMDFSRNWNIRIALENTPPGRIGDKLEEIQLILEIISSKALGICLDTGHYLLNNPEIEQGKLNLYKILINWQTILFHIHLHDNDGMHDLHLLPQEGIFPWTSFISFLREINYQGTLIIEPKEKDDLTDYLNRIFMVRDKIRSLVQDQ